MKKIYLLPNLVTTANLVCGFLAMIDSFKGEYLRACYLIIIAAICDSLDGRIARMARATSPFGVQYDSLSDLTSFGIAPAIMIYCFALQDAPRFFVGAAGLYVVCAALRLARFNVSAEESDPTKLKKIRKGYFQGLPSPASAGLVVTAVMMQNEFLLLPESIFKIFFAILGLVMALLMVSNIPFPSFKYVNWRSKGTAWILLMPAILIFSGIQAPELTLFALGYAYLVFSLVWSAYLFFNRNKNPEVSFETQ